MTSEDILKRCKQKFMSLVEDLKSDLSKISAGKASADFLDVVMVDAYDNGKSKIKSLATINVRDTSTLTVQVWDKSVMSKVANAITEANLNVLVKKDKDFIIVSLPSLTEEVRKGLVKKAAEITHKKVTLLQDFRHQFRKEADSLKQTAGEDAQKRTLTEIDKYKDQYTKEMNNLLSEKETNLMKL